MLRTIFWSFKKSVRLQKISRKLAPQPDGGESFVRDFTEGGFDAINQRLNQVEEGKKQLFTLIRKDPWTSKLVKEHELGNDDLSDLYDNLIRNGAGILKKGHWIPASSLAYKQTFSYILRHKNDGNDKLKKICFRLSEYFDNSETGEIYD